MKWRQNKNIRWELLSRMFFENFLCLSRTTKSKFCCKVNRVLNSSPAWWASSLRIVSTINRSKSISSSPRSSKSTQLHTHLTKGVWPIPWCAAEAVDCGLSWIWNCVDQQLWFKLVYKLKVLLPKLQVLSETKLLGMGFDYFHSKQFSSFLFRNDSFS